MMWNEAKGAGKWCPENDMAYQKELAAKMDSKLFEEHYLGKFEPAVNSKQYDAIKDMLDKDLGRREICRHFADDIHPRDVIRCIHEIQGRAERGEKD